MELPSTETAQVDPSAEEWFASYADPYVDPSRRSRRTRHRRRRGPNRKQRELIGTAFMVASVLFVGALTAVFYTVLSR
jgi:hypothetical protein